MKAVNLIPEDLRGAGGGAPGRSGGAVYAALGGLAVLLLLVTAWGLTSRAVTNKTNEVARVTAEAQNAEQRAGELAPYQRFADLRKKRADTVASLSRTRFNWPYALREISRVLPADTWLNQVTGTVAPGVQVDDANNGDTSSLRSQLAAPAIEILGCSTGQAQVAKYLAALRQIEGVTRVSLALSSKLDTASASGGGTESDTDCRQGNVKIPRFGLVVFFERSTATASTAVAGAPSTTATATATAKETGK